MRHQKAVSEVLRSDPNIDVFMSSAGGRGGASASNSGFFFVSLKPRAQRKLTADQVVEGLRPRLAAIPGPARLRAEPAARSRSGRASRAASTS